MKQRLDRFQKTPDVGDEGNDKERENSIERQLQETQNALPKRKDEEQDAAENAENEAGSEPEDKAVSQLAPGSASAPIQEMPMEIEDEDMPAHYGQIDLTAVDPAEIKVPCNMVGTVIDMTVPPSEARPVKGGTQTHSTSYDENNPSLHTTSRRTIAPSLPIMPQERPSLPLPSAHGAHRRSETFPTDAAEHLQSIEEQPATTLEDTILDGRECAPTLAVNLISDTPRTSHDAPAQTITHLLVPKNIQNAPKPRSRSRTPVPPESPMVTRSQSRSPNPAASALHPPPPAPVTDSRARSKSPMNLDSDHVRGEKRKATYEDGPHKRKKQ